MTTEKEWATLNRVGAASDALAEYERTMQSLEGYIPAASDRHRMAELVVAVIHWCDSRGILLDEVTDIALDNYAGQVQL